MFSILLISVVVASISVRFLYVRTYNLALEDCLDIVKADWDNVNGCVINTDEIRLLRKKF